MDQCPTSATRVSKPVGLALLHTVLLTSTVLVITAAFFLLVLLFDPYRGVESRSGGLDAQHFPATVPRKNVRILFHVQTVFKATDQNRF